VKYNTVNNIIGLILIICAPLVLLNAFSLITNELILSVLKFFLVGIGILLIPFQSYKIKNKLDLYLYIFIFYIVILTIVNRSFIEIEYSILYVIPFLLFFIRKKEAFQVTFFELKYFIIIILMAFVMLVMTPKIIFAGREIFMPIINGPHTTTYSILIFYFFIFLGYQKNMLTKITFFFITIIVFVIVFGYKARNAELALIMFFTTYYFYKSKLDNNLRNIILFLLFNIFLFLIYAINVFYNPDWNEISSGRLFVWLERINIALSYEWEKLLLGGGYGADLMYTTQWWWEKKASHNDLLSLVFNSGLFSLILFLVIVSKLFQFSNNFQKAILVFLIVTSLTNTGYLGRPIQFFYLVIIYIAANSSDSKKDRYCE